MGTNPRVRLDLGVATHCPETIFCRFLPKNPACFLPFKLLADKGYFDGVLRVKIEILGAFPVVSGRFYTTRTRGFRGRGPGRINPRRRGAPAWPRQADGAAGGRERIAGVGLAHALADGEACGASSSMARTGKRKAGGLARAQSRQARLSIQFAKRLSRVGRRKTPASDKLPWWARPRTPGQR